MNQLLTMSYKSVLISYLSEDKDRDDRLREVLEFTKCQGCKIIEIKQQM